MIFVRNKNIIASYIIKRYLIAFLLSSILAFCYFPFFALSFNKVNNTLATLEIKINQNNTVTGTLSVSFMKPAKATDSAHPFIIFPFNIENPNIENPNYDPQLVKLGFGHIGPTNIGPVKEGYSKLDIISAPARENINISFKILAPILYPNQIEDPSFEQHPDFLIILKDYTAISHYTFDFRFDTQTKDQLYDDGTLNDLSKAMIIPYEVYIKFPTNFYPYFSQSNPYNSTNIYTNKPQGTEDSKSNEYTTPIAFYQTSDLWINYSLPSDKKPDEPAQPSSFFLNLLILISAFIPSILSIADIASIQIRIRICFAIILLSIIVFVLAITFRHVETYNYIAQNQALFDIVLAGYIIGLLSLSLKFNIILQDIRNLRHLLTFSIHVSYGPTQPPAGPTQPPAGPTQPPAGPI